MNDLPSGLLAGGALRSVLVPPQIRDAVLIGVDLGPNLSVTGSLATVLWLIALRREGERIDGWQFLKTGLVGHASRAAAVDNCGFAPVAVAAGYAFCRYRRRMRSVS